MRFLTLTRKNKSPAGRKRATSRRPHRIWVRRAVLPASIATVLLSAGGTGYWLWASGRVADAVAGAEHRVIGWTAESGLVISAVQVEGRQETPSREVMAALGVHMGQPILDFDPKTAKARLEKIGWIREATVERRLPGTIVVRLVERQPVALWQRDEKLYLVDGTGTVILSSGLGRFSHLPMVVGEDAAKNTSALFTMLALAPNLESRVSAAVRVGERRWDLHLDNGVVVRLPEDGAAEAWQRLAEIEHEHRLLERDIVAVDLRIGKRLIVQLPPDVAKSIREPGANT